MKYCIFCGASVPLDKDICPNCNEVITDDTINKKFDSIVKCVNCGSDNVGLNINKTRRGRIAYDNEVYICGECGRRFTDRNRLGPSFNNKPKILYSRGFHKFIIFIIVLFALGTFWYNHKMNVKRNANGTYYPYSIVDGKETTKSEFTVGEKFFCQNKAVVVNKVEYPKTIDKKKPDKGYKYILLNVTITNRANTRKNYDGGDFRINTSDGVKTQISYEEKGRFVSGMMESGTSKTGDVVFSVPEKDKEFIVNYYCDYWIDELIANIKVK